MIARGALGFANVFANLAQQRGFSYIDLVEEANEPKVINK